jgi:hypothetical protein
MADRLFLDGLISASVQERIRQVWDFGRAIRNTDMHFGNLSFHPTGKGGFTLAPIYDMLPMAYAPNAAGLPGFEPATTPFQVIQAQTEANDFWQRLSMDARLSESFRNIAQLHLAKRRGEPHGW